MSEELLARLEAESAIRRLVGLYCDAINRLEPKAAAALYAPDATIRIAGGPEIHGAEAIEAGMVLSLGNFDFLRMQCGISAIDVQGDRAQARLLVFEATHKLGDGQMGLLWGVYEDRHVSLAQGWRFQRRDYTLQLRTMVPVAKMQQVEGLDLAFSFAP